MSPKWKLPWPASRDDRAKVEWILACWGVTCGRGAPSVAVLVDPRSADDIINWINIGYSESDVGKQTQLRFHSTFLSWIVRKAAEYNLDLYSTKYGKSLAAVEARCDLFFCEFDEVKREIVKEIEERMGHTGCDGKDDGGNLCEETEHFEFDHIDQATKIAEISYFLWKGFWDEARIEGRKCRLVCRNCHVAKTIDMKETLGGPRKPIGDATLERERERIRQQNTRLREIGKQRLLAAKLAIGKCADCHRVCDSETVKGFNFYFLYGKKRAISRMNLVGDVKFAAELAKCVLVCHGHWKKRTSDKCKRKYEELE